MDTETSLVTGYTRRRWVKRFVLGTAAALSGPQWSSRVMAEILPDNLSTGVLRIKAASFPALADPGGSIQLTFTEGVHPFTLNRVSADRFVALDSVCTHAGCVVGRFIVANNRMRCPCHGSRYDIEGRVFRDANGNSTQPAPDDLARFATEFDTASGTVSIAIPQLALRIASISVHRPGENGTLRLKLVFPATYGSTYEIGHHADLSAPFQAVAFSLSPEGEASETSIGPSVSGEVTAYVDASGERGFFAVALKLAPHPHQPKA